MNIHHLELFYYVAKHRGVSEAARRIPYGIQQPAISAQIIQLEDNLGTTLFHRRPFQLTRAGEQLFEFIQPFFGELDAVARRLRGGAEASIRIGAPEIIQRDYLPRLLKRMRERVPALHFTLVVTGAGHIESGLVAQEIDIGIAPLVEKRSDGVKQRELLRVAMGLMVPTTMGIKTAEELWKLDRIAHPLITGALTGPVYRVFQRDLQKRKVEWFSSLELNSQELIARYVVEGFGIGLILIEPGFSAPPGARLLPLRGFSKVPYGLLWIGSLSPLQKTFCDEAEAVTKELAPHH